MNEKYQTKFHLIMRFIRFLYERGSSGNYFTKSICNLSETPKAVIHSKRQQVNLKYQKFPHKTCFIVFPNK